jgi:hypothetical protein
VADSAAEIGDAPRAYGGIIERAAEADIGFPQSMQKREEGSFSRPQKEQAVGAVTRRSSRPWEANIAER